MRNELRTTRASAHFIWLRWGRYKTTSRCNFQACGHLSAECSYVSARLSSPLVANATSAQIYAPRDGELSRRLFWWCRVRVCVDVRSQQRWCGNDQFPQFLQQLSDFAAPNANSQATLAHFSLYFSPPAPRIIHHHVVCRARAHSLALKSRQPRIISVWKGNWHFAPGFFTLRRLSILLHFGRV